MFGTSRTMLTPGASTGTMNIEARLCGAASGSVTAITMRKSAIEPFDVNHLCPVST
jgi:precorrin-6B methylase 2